jgi:hypothetical protein
LAGAKGGDKPGARRGAFDGDVVGVVGAAEGKPDGNELGARVGVDEGVAEGTDEGAAVGVDVGPSRAMQWLSSLLARGLVVASARQAWSDGDGGVEVVRGEGATEGRGGRCTRSRQKLAFCITPRDAAPGE